MQRAASAPKLERLVFLGGGHSHALVVRMLGMRAIEGAACTVISNVTLTPYSGMLPGYIAGYYTADQIHIDLRKLCEFSGVRFIRAAVREIDLENKRVVLSEHPDVEFDYLSVNTGSTPSMAKILGAEEFGIPAKPVPQLLAGWDEVLREVEDGEEPHITVVGGGAGGVELAVCMQRRLNFRVPVRLIHSGPQLVETHNEKVRELVRELLRERKIEVHLNTNVSEIGKDFVKCGPSGDFRSDHTFVVTNASAPTWARSSGLAVDDSGFIRVADTLQSISHPFVFAAGDVASMPSERPKSGVFAVRQAKPLHRNLKQVLKGAPLVPYRPQSQFLTLIGTATGEAIGSRKWLAYRSKLMWIWKDWIDRKFMRKFHELPVPTETGLSPERAQSPKGPPLHSTNETIQQLKQASKFRCTGCAAKVGGSVLTEVLERIKEKLELNDVEIAIDLGDADDAAVFSVPSDQSLVQTVDFFPALVSDPFLLGKISTEHCFNDVLAMGAKPHSALALVQLPFAARKIMREELYQLLLGSISVLQNLGATLIGGHTGEAEQLGFGLACNGLIEPGAGLRKMGMRPGQALVITKGIGTGAIFAAHMRYQASGEWIDSALENMLLSNKVASEVLQRFGATACTDVTGFGLAGHLLEMVSASGCGVQLALNRVPTLPGSIDVTRTGFRSSLYVENVMAEKQIGDAASVKELAHYPLLYDPQTSGPLIASVDLERVEECLESLRESGYPAADVFAEVTEMRDSQQPIMLVNELDHEPAQAQAGKKSVVINNVAL